MFDAYAGDFWH